MSTTISSCKKEINKEVASTTASVTKGDPFFKLSLAQWSLNQYVRTEKKSPFHFASQAKEMGFEGLEYVSQLYKFEVEKLGFDVVIDSLKTLSEREKIQNDTKSSGTYSFEKKSIKESEIPKSEEKKVSQNPKGKAETFTSKEKKATSIFSKIRQLAIKK